MKKYLIALFLTLSATAAFAGSNSGLTYDAVDSAGWSKLSESQKADIIKRVADTKHQAEVSASDVKAAVSSPQKVNDWLDVGTKIGQMFGGAAKEIGVQVNDFVKTPVGMWTMAIIVWKFMGGVIVHLFGGILVMAVGLTTVFLIGRTQRRITYTYSSDKTDLFGRARLLRVDKGQMDNDWSLGLLLMSGITLIVSIGVMFSY